MKDLIIVCGGSYGKELYSTIGTINKNAESLGKDIPYNVLGFLDDNPHALDGSGIRKPILGRIADWKPRGSEVYAIGAAFPETKSKIALMLKERGCIFETLIHPSSIICDDIIMGEGCYITAYYISAGVKLGNFVNINGSMLCPGAEVCDFSTTTGFTVVDYKAKVGKRVFLGSHSVISPGVTVGDDAKVAVGSIVTDDVRPGVMVFGVPASEIG